MAVKFCPGAGQVIATCASGDTKPTAYLGGQKLKPGDCVYVSDTGVFYITLDGSGTDWTAYTQQIGTTVQLTTGAATIGAVKVLDSGGTTVSETTYHSIKVTPQYSGAAYSNTHTQASDVEYRFETSSKKLSSAYIQVVTYSQLVGATGTEAYTQTTAAAPMILYNVDLSTLYFKNATGGQNGTINIVGTLA